MVIDIGAGVVTSDGKKVGSVERVVVEPNTGEVTHLVLHKGVILTRDTVIPISAVSRKKNHHVHLSLTAKELDGMPEFVETEYVIPQHTSPTGPYVPGSVLWPTAYAYAPTVVREERHVPPTSIEITEGTDVVCGDGKVGVVDEVVAADKRGALIGFVLKDGVTGRRKGVIPVSWITSADRKSVRLDRSKREVEDYFKYEDIRG